MVKFHVEISIKEIGKIEISFFDFVSVLFYSKYTFLHFSYINFLINIKMYISLHC